MDKKPLRTTKQNSALHKLLTELADELNSSGKTMTKVLSQNADILWTPYSTKEFLLKPIIKAMYGKESTTQLSTKELSAACEFMLNHIAKTTGVALEFPSISSMEQESKERVYR